MRAGLVLAVLASMLLAPVQAERPVDGHWEVLGEDGAIFVPREPPATLALPPPDLGSYHTWEELGAALQALAGTYPHLVTLTTAGTSVEGRAIHQVTLRAGADDGRPAVLFDGAHHGDEVIASEILLRYAQRLAAGYGTNATATSILDGTSVVIVPMVNPDGVARAPTSEHYATPRKNANGVDINRNYPFAWGLPGASAAPSDPTYRGPAPASEPETQAIAGLLASRPWTFYASLHSGAEMILWPWGWTTAPPPEAALYQSLGAELSARTGAPHGQVSRILYGVSGASMDHAYGAAGPGWKPISVSPETYEGTGNAFDWWPLFNPPDSGINATVVRWTAFLDHLALQAGAYAPATLEVPAGIVASGHPFDLSATVTASPKRPLLGANASLSVPSFLAPAQTLALGDVAGARSMTWTLTPSSGGEGDARVRIAAGPAGNLTARVPIRVEAPGVTLALDRASAGSGETVGATLRAFSDVALAGDATLSFDGRVLDARRLQLAAGAEDVWRVEVPVAAARAGLQSAELVLAYVTDAGIAGTVRASASLFVERPQLEATATHPTAVRAGEAFNLSVIVRNSGTQPARNVTISALVPAGYALVPRDVGVPLPADPLARPAPRRAEVGPDGRVALEWDLVGISPGGSFAYQMRLLPLAPGDHALETGLAYRSATYGYEERASSAQRVVGPA